MGLFKPMKKLPITLLTGDLTMIANEVILVSRPFIAKCLRASLLIDFTVLASTSNGNFRVLKKLVTAKLFETASSTEISACGFDLVLQMPSLPIQVQNAGNSIALSGGVSVSTNIPPKLIIYLVTGCLGNPD